MKLLYRFEGHLEIMKKIFLHIGLRKTGTTSFQQFISRKHDFFEDLGIFVPPAGRVINLDGVRFKLGYGGLHDIPKQIKNRKGGLLDIVLDDFEKKQLNTMILSSEGFDKFQQKDVEFLAEKLKNYDVQPIIGLRHPVQRAKSSFCSLGRVSGRPPSGYIQMMTEEVDTHYVNLCKYWSVFGLIKVFLLEQTNDIAQDILTYILANSENKSKLNEISKMQVPRRRESLPVPIAIVNQELFRSLGLQANKQFFLDRIYPYLVLFRDSSLFKEIDFGVSLKELSPFSLDDEKLFLRQIKNQVNLNEVLNLMQFANEEEKQLFIKVISKYNQPSDDRQISSDLVKTTKGKFLEFCFPDKKVYKI